MFDWKVALILYAYIGTCFVLAIMALGLYNRWWMKDKCPKCYTIYGDGWNKRTPSNLCSECLRDNEILGHKRSD